MPLNLLKKKQIIGTDLILELLSKEEPISRRANVLYICVRQAAGGGRLRESQAIVRRAPARAPDPVLPVPPLGSLLLHSWLDTRVEKSTSTVIVPSLLLLLLSEQLSASQDIFLPVTDNVNLMVAKELWSV